MAEEIGMRLTPTLPRQFGQRAMNLVEPLGYALPPCASEISSANAEMISRSFLIEAMPRFENVNSLNIVGSGLRERQRQQQQSEQRVPCSPLPQIQPRFSMDTEYSIELLAEAYKDCRRHKRNTDSALRFEQNLEHNLIALHDELSDGSYKPGKSICFVITKPKPREVWAADFRDRIVHHLLYNRLAPIFHARFIVDSCACIPGRGTLYGAKRLESKVRSITQNWSKHAYYLKLDLANFFVSIDKNILRKLIAKRVTEPWWMQLADTILFHDPRQNYELRGEPRMLDLVPSHKRLTNHPAHLGLPIGNLSSQFFANIYLDELDQFCKHKLQARHYIRYVDDFLILHESPQWLNAAKAEIEEFLFDELRAKINPSKTILQPVSRGVDFVGQVIRPWHRTTRKRTINEAMRRVSTVDSAELYETANSYFGLMRQATHSYHQRVLLSNVLRKRGHTISANLTKTYRKTA
jgi:retron-type reverse transcriptase